MGRISKPTREEARTLRRAAADRAAAGELGFTEGVRALRRATGFTQAEFAKMTKMTVRQLAEIEAGKANPTIETMSRIGNLFGFRIGFIPKGAAKAIEPIARASTTASFGPERDDRVPNRTNGKD